MRALRRRKTREEQGLFLAEGIRLVEELLASPCAPRRALVSARLAESERGRALEAALEAACPVERVRERELASVAATETPQGVVVAAEIPRVELSALDINGPEGREWPEGVEGPEDMEGAERLYALVLDAVQDPGNFGTLTRTAAAFGARFVAALPGTVDPWNAKAVRSAVGASFHVPIVRPRPAELLSWLREHGFALYGADASGMAVDDVAFSGRCALAVGNEGAGLRRELREAVNTLVAVPMPGRAESLNVGVAAGILTYMITRRE